MLLASLMLSFLAGTAIAQDVRVYRANETIDPRDVAQILDSTQPAAMKMRSIRVLDDASPAKDTPSKQVVASASAEEPRVRSSALSLPVQFSFDSSDILPAARKQLDALAEGLRMLPNLQSVVIEGHTDATGSDAYNEQLSQRRAMVVKHYLVAMHGIDPARLRAVGLGKYVPLPGADRYAPENRRVQFRGE
jgi:outer membrane protein OmpA-like peptidoglycan-associated protein